MVILYEIGDTGDAEQLLADPFSDEVNDMEPFIIENLSILNEGDEQLHFITKEATDSKTGKRQDILALDDNGRLVIIELKRDKADENDEPQIRGYLKSKRENPDSIRNYCNESKFLPSDIKYDSSIEPKVIVVAPEISDDWIDTTTELRFDIDFIEVKRFKKGSQTYVSVNDKAPKQIKRPRESTSREDYTWEHYSKDLKWNEEDIQVIKDFAEKLSKLKEEHGMDLHVEFREPYIPFKHGPRRNVFDFSVQKRKIYIRLNPRLKDPNTKINGKPLNGLDPGWYWSKNHFELEFDKDSIPELSILLEPIKMAYALT